MLKSCPKCGSANGQHRRTCYICEAELTVGAQAPQRAVEDSAALAADILANIPETAGLPPETESQASTQAGAKSPVPIRPLTTQTAPPEPEWRREVSHRLQAYRASRRRMAPDASQNPLPFDAQGGLEGVATDTLEEIEGAAEPDPREALRMTARPRSNEPLEIAVQPELVFLADDHMPHPRERLVPVAELGERRKAALLDAVFLLISYGIFLVLFGSLGGQFSASKVNALIFGATFFLFYVQYFALFTIFGGVTPGMNMCHLHVVGFDGHAPLPQQLLWRSFGYIVSGTTMFLGFLWALWDEDQLTWQDRISQTYLTSAALPAETEQAAPNA